MRKEITWKGSWVSSQFNKKLGKSPEVAQGSPGGDLLTGVCSLKLTPQDKIEGDAQESC